MTERQVGDAAGPDAPEAPLPPWFARAAARARGHAAIVGGGIAGAGIAYALQRRGWTCTVIDRRSGATEASDMPMGVIMPRLTAGDGIEGRFHAAAWRFALQTLNDLAEDGLPLSRQCCGVVQIADTDAEAERLMAIAARGLLPEPFVFAMSAAEASDRAGCAIHRPALYFPQGGWLQPRALCEALGHRVSNRITATAAGTRCNGGRLQVVDTADKVCAEADVVVLANGLGATAFPGAGWLPLTARRGQVTLAPATARSAKLRTVIVGDGYITPAADGRHCIGATFDWVEDARASQHVAPEDHARNLAQLDRLLPGLLNGVAADMLDGRAALRCMTPDHLPVAGPLPDQSAYVSDYAQLRHGRHWVRYPSATYVPGVYVLTGLGARGLTTAHLAAEVLACHITGEPWPIERDLVTALHPGRFLVRDLKRVKA